MSAPRLRTPGEEARLYSPQALLQFGRNDAELLVRKLREIEDGTELQAIDGPEDLQLDADACLPNGYRLTSLAFSQISQLIAPGLSSLLPDIVGTTVLPDERASLIDAGLGLTFWNELVTVRWQLFQAHRLIANTVTKQVEGMMGYKHQYLENRVFFEAVQETVERQAPTVKFHAGMLLGRQLALWYRNDTPICTHTINGERWPFFYGYYFTNGEATGTAVRGTLAIYTRAGLCLAPYKPYGARMSHAGRNFYQQLSTMLTVITSKEVPLDTLIQGITGLLETSLGFDRTWDKQHRLQHQRRLVHALGQTGVPQKIASAAVERGLTAGRLLGKATFMPMHDVSHLYAKRTLLDLFIPLMHIARAVDLTRRERIERTAFAVLMGHILPRSTNHGSSSTPT